MYAAIQLFAQNAVFSERDLTPLEVDILGEVRKLSEDKQRALLELIRGE